MDKRTYRRESILRWKKKRCNMKINDDSNEKHLTTLFASNDLSKRLECANGSLYILNEKFKEQDSNMNNPISHEFYTPPITNEVDIINKKKYTSESVITWQKKRHNNKTQHVLKETKLNTLFSTNSFTERGESSARSIPIINERIG